MRKESWIVIAKDLIGKQRLDCAYCPANRPEEKPNVATQGAHALVYRRVYNNRKSHKKIDVRENFLPCCDDCQKFSETRKGREHAWGVLVSWYGEDRIKSWYNGLKLKVKEVFE